MTGAPWPAVHHILPTKSRACRETATQPFEITWATDTGTDNTTLTNHKSSMFPIHTKVNTAVVLKAIRIQIPKYDTTWTSHLSSVTNRQTTHLLLYNHTTRETCPLISSGQVPSSERQMLIESHPLSEQGQTTERASRTNKWSQPCCRHRQFHALPANAPLFSISNRWNVQIQPCYMQQSNHSATILHSHLGLRTVSIHRVYIKPQFFNLASWRVDMVRTNTDSRIINTYHKPQEQVSRLYGEDTVCMASQLIAGKACHITSWLSRASLYLDLYPGSMPVNIAWLPGGK